MSESPYATTFGIELIETGSDSFQATAWLRTIAGNLRPGIYKIVDQTPSHKIISLTPERKIRSLSHAA